jgi:hypothetical protein
VTALPSSSGACASRVRRGSFLLCGVPRCGKLGKTGSSGRAGFPGGCPGGSAGLRRFPGSGVPCRPPIRPQAPTLSSRGQRSPGEFLFTGRNFPPRDLDTYFQAVESEGQAVQSIRRWISNGPLLGAGGAAAWSSFSPWWATPHSSRGFFAVVTETEVRVLLRRRSRTLTPFPAFERICERAP